MKAARIAVDFRMRGSYNVTVVQSISPTSLPSKDICITFKYNCWLLLKFKLPPLSDVICLLPYFRHWINAFKGKTNDVVIFEQITDSFFFLSTITATIFVFDHANHTRKKMKSSWEQCVSFHAQIAYCLKTEALAVLSIWLISWCKSNCSKRMNTKAWRFPLNRVRCFIFGCSNPSLVRKVWRAIEIQSPSFFSIFGFDHANHTR